MNYPSSGSGIGINTTNVNNQITSRPSSARPGSSGSGSRLQQPETRLQQPDTRVHLVICANEPHCQEAAVTSVFNPNEPAPLCTRCQLASQRERNQRMIQPLLNKQPHQQRQDRVELPIRYERSGVSDSAAAISGYDAPRSHLYDTQRLGSARAQASAKISGYEPAGRLHNPISTGVGARSRYEDPVSSSSSTMGRYGNYGLNRMLTCMRCSRAFEVALNLPHNPLYCPKCESSRNV
jgi:hypothetical protein